MQVTYCRRWNFLYGGPIDPLTVEQARAADGTGDAYAVGIGDTSDPDVVLEVTWQNDYLGVWFFDKHGRQSIKYSFGRVEGRLFLDEMTRWEYPSPESRSLIDARLIETIFYSQDGTVRDEIIDKTAAQRRVTDRHSVDVSPNWEPAPEFGDWLSVSRFDRG